MTDPRIEAAAEEIGGYRGRSFELDWWTAKRETFVSDAELVLAAADAADREAGIYRIKLDDGTRSALHDVLYERRFNTYPALASAVVAFFRAWAEGAE